MNKIVLRCNLLVLLLMLIMGNIVTLEASTNKHILLLHSYHKGLQWSDEISRGVETVLEAYPNYQLTTEYMDTLKNEDPMYLSYLYSLFALKLKQQNYDAVIAADDFAVDFLLNNKDELFPNTPVFFCGIEKNNPYVDVKRILDKKIPLIFKNTEVDTNLQAIQQIIPNLKNIYIISDTTNDSVSIKPLLMESAKKLESKGIHVTLNTDSNLEKIADDLAHLPQHSAVLLGTLHRDNYGHYIPYYTVDNLIQHSSAPVFAIGDTFISKGIVGGYVLRGYENGKRVAEIAVAYLHGKIKESAQPIIASNEWIFDDKMLRHYDINTALLPKNATLINLPQSFFDQHKRFVKDVFIAFPFVIFSLIIAIFYLYQRYRNEKILTSKQQWEQVLLSNIESSIFWIDTQGIFKGCNDSFCVLLGRTLQEVIGQKIGDVFSQLTLDLKEGQLFSLSEIDFIFHEKIYRLKSQQFFDENEKNGGIVCVIADVTEKKQLEIQMQINIQQSKMVEVAEMISAIVHQWKVPLVELSAIAHKMHYYDMKKRLTSEHIQKFYTIIMQQTIYMSETIDGFRDFIRPSHEAKRFEIDIVIQEVLSLLSSAMKYHHITIDYSSAQKSMIFGFPNELKQVLVNILNNAKDAILEAREKRNPACGNIDIKVHPLENQVTISICDDGIGIDKKIYHKLFEPFFTTKPQGDGFGLYMARLIIESKMHGDISLEPLHNGAQVHLMLPRSKE